MQGLGLERWLRHVESDESRDREDGTGARSASTGSLSTTVVSMDQASDAVRDSASSLRKEGRSCKRRRNSPEPDTEELPEYELARLKRIKTNQEMLVSLGIENPLRLPRSQRRGRRRPLAAPTDDHTPPGTMIASPRSLCLAAEGQVEPGGESSASRSSDTRTHVAAESDNAKTRVALEGIWRPVMSSDAHDENLEPMVAERGEGTIPVGGTDQQTSERGWGQLPQTTSFLSFEPRTPGTHSHAEGRRLLRAEASMGIPSCSNVAVGFRDVQGGSQDEQRMEIATTSRQREVATPKTPATKRRKRPISSSYNLDIWLNKTRGVGGEGGGDSLRGRLG